MQASVHLGYEGVANNGNAVFTCSKCAAPSRNVPIVDGSTVYPPEAALWG